MNRQDEPSSTCSSRSPVTAAISRYHLRIVANHRVSGMYLRLLGDHGRPRVRFALGWDGQRLLQWLSSVVAPPSDQAVPPPLAPFFSATNIEKKFVERGA